MDKRKFNVVTVSFIALIVLIVALLMASSLHRTAHIVLPEAAVSASGGSSSLEPSDDAVVKIEITPKTVQAAVATLQRPDRYQRSLTVETIWSGGSNSEQVSVAVSGGMTRTDLTQPDGRVRHSITDGTTTYVWYDSSKTYYSGSAGDITADEEQGIPTYEDVLRLNTEQIVAADYRTFSDAECIYVETAADDAGYALRYWVSVKSGLLAGAEKQKDGTTVYRMAAQPVQGDSPGSSSFTLPDGTVLKPAG